MDKHTFRSKDAENPDSLDTQSHPLSVADSLRSLSASFQHSDDNYSDNETTSQQSVDIPLSPPTSYSNLPPGETAPKRQNDSPSSVYTGSAIFNLGLLGIRQSSTESSLSKYEAETKDGQVTRGSAISPDPTPSATAVTSPLTPKSTARASTAASVVSSTSTSSIAKKVRPESLVIDPKVAKLVIGLAVVDFNHLVRLLICHSSSKLMVFYAV